MNRASTSVSVLVDLEWSARAGGHVLCWQRIAEAAVEENADVDLTLHVQGAEAKITELSDRVRIAAHRPVFSSARLPFLRGIADYTDLAPFHPGLLRALMNTEVVHTTDACFAYSKTARLATRLTGAALVSSLHTDTAHYTRIYSEQVLRRIFGRGAIARALIEKLRAPERLARRIERRLGDHLARSRWTWLSERSLSEGRLSERSGGSPPNERTSILRRGIDKARFHPQRRRRASLVRFGVAEDQCALLFVGRLDEVKSATLCARACEASLFRGLDVSAIFVGDGPLKEEIQRRLGARAHLLGSIPQDELALIYASADIFVFPSSSEISPNVVLEAKASGLPVIVARHGGDVFVRENGVDGLIVEGTDPQEWAAAIESLVRDPLRRSSMSRAARRDIEEHHPSWREVYTDDLLPVWRRVARERARPLARRHAHA